MRGDNEGPPALSLGLSTLGRLVSVAFHAEGPSHSMCRGAPSDGDVREPVVYKALFWALPCKGADASPARSPLDGCSPLGTGPHHPKPLGSLGHQLHWVSLGADFLGVTVGNSAPRSRRAGELRAERGGRAGDLCALQHQHPVSR